MDGLDFLSNPPKSPINTADPLLTDSTLRRRSTRVFVGVKTSLNTFSNSVSESANEETSRVLCD